MLLAKLSYDPASGKIHWVRRNGREAGYINKDGYRVIEVSGAACLAHRIAWAIHTGDHPTGVIDHINGDRADNRAANLRDVSRQTNSQNIKLAHRDSGSKVLGITWHSRDRRWQAKICVSGRIQHLGNFKDKESAHAAYLLAKRTLHKGCTI